MENRENGKGARETLAANFPLMVDHFRYIAAVIRADSGDISGLDANNVSM